MTQQWLNFACNPNKLGNCNILFKIEMLCDVLLFVCCQASEQGAICVMKRIKRKLEEDTDQLVCEHIMALQYALQESNAELAELRAELATLKKPTFLPCSTSDTKKTPDS